MSTDTPAPALTLREELNALAERQAQAHIQTQGQIADIRRDIRQIRCDTREVVEMFRALSGGFTVLRWLGRGAIFMAAVAAAITASFTALKGWLK